MVEIKNVKEFVKFTEKYNQIFKTVYNSEIRQNIWSCRFGDISMYHEKQFPSLVEIYMNSDSLVTAKGKKSKAGEEVDKFLEELQNIQFSINSIKYFEFLKENKKFIDKILVDDNEITFIAGESKYVETFQPHKEINVGNQIENMIASTEIIEKMIDKNNEPFNMILNLDESKVELDSDISNLESFLRIKLNKKFFPYLKRPTEKDKVSLEVDIYDTLTDYIYDIGFNITLKTITVYSLIRIIEY